MTVQRPTQTETTIALRRLELEREAQRMLEASRELLLVEAKRLVRGPT
jgi:hypothetical protein